MKLKKVLKVAFLRKGHADLYAILLPPFMQIEIWFNLVTK